MPRVPRRLRGRPQPLPPRQRAEPAQRRPGARGPRFAAAAHGDLRGPAGGGAHRRPRGPDADPGAGGDRLRPLAAHARAGARNRAAGRADRAAPAAPNPLEPWRARDDRRAHDLPPAGPQARHGRYREGPRRGPARAPAARAAGPSTAAATSGSRDRFDVHVRHPLTRETAHVFSVEHGAVATSGLDTRLWHAPDGTPRHHLLDPSTLQPAWTGVVSATALAPTAVEAEALAKAALLSGPTRAKRWLRRHGGLIVHDDGRTEILEPRPVVRLEVAA